MNQVPTSPGLRADDERAISRVLSQWCRAIDRLDLAAVRLVFHADAFDDHVFYRGDIEGLVAALRKRHDNISFSCHQLGNVLVEFAGPNQALVESYAFVTQHVRGEASTKVQTSWCRYIDRFEVRDGQWRITHRVLVIDAAEERPLATQKVFSLPTGNAGRRDNGDPVYVARREMGISNPSS